MVEQPTLILGRSGQLVIELANRFRMDGVAYFAGGRPGIGISVAGSVTAMNGRSNVRRVVKAAAYTAVDQAESEPDLVFSKNADGSACIASACAHKDLPLLCVTTDDVFNGVQSSPYTKSRQTEPIEMYGSPVTRPAKVQLDCGKPEQKFGVSLPCGKVGVSDIVGALITEMTGSMK